MDRFLVAYASFFQFSTLVVSQNYPRQRAKRSSRARNQHEIMIRLLSNIKIHHRDLGRLFIVSSWSHSKLRNAENNLLNKMPSYALPLNKLLARFLLIFSVFYLRSLFVLWHLKKIKQLWSTLTNKISLILSTWFVSADAKVRRLLGIFFRGRYLTIRLRRRSELKRPFICLIKFF